MEVVKVAIAGRRNGTGLLEVSGKSGGKLVLSFDSGTYSSDEQDLFGSLQSLRGLLEESDLRLCVQGASRLVLPSGMLRGTRRAYRWSQNDPREVVDILAPASEDEIVGVDEQRQAHKTRLKQELEARLKRTLEDQ